jgi:aminopeptidase-like protein
VTVEHGAGAAALGAQLHRFVSDLYPICRSITGNGLRRTLALIGEHIPLTLHEVPSGTAVFDWTVPLEWNITDAYVKTLAGERVIDFTRSNLHVVGYSEPVRARVSRAELDAHLFSLPGHPDWIPYRTSYYERSWGFCVSQRQRDQLTDREYEVVVDASLEPGHLTIGECVLPGDTADEVLISCHACHPSLCNDNLSGIAVATFLAKRLASQPRRFTYRFLFIPGTIGSITWLARNQATVPRIRHGLVLTCLGDPGALTYKRSRRETADVDRAAEHVLGHSGAPFTVEPFSPWGYDERQYCSPGFDLPVGCLMRTPHGRFPEYHTSADDLDLVRAEALADSLETCAAILRVLDGNRCYVNLAPKGEPQLGKRGLYSAIGGVPDAGAQKMAMLWVLNLSDGGHSLLDIAQRSGLAFAVVAEAAGLLASYDLLRIAPGDSARSPV